MNKNSSREYTMGRLRGARRPDAREYPQCVLENQREASTIYFALIDSRGPRTTDDFSLSKATRVPPATVLVRPASLGSSALMYARLRGGIWKGPMHRVLLLRKKLGRGVSYET
jgi:hypothetical protein